MNLIGLEIQTINGNLEGKATRILKIRQKMSGSYGVVEGQFDDVDDEVYDIYLCQMYILIFRVILNSFIQKSYLCQWYFHMLCNMCNILV